MPIALPTDTARTALGLAAVRLREMKKVGGVTAQVLAERLDLERDPETWLRANFPRHLSAPFSDHHRDFWQWLWTIERGVPATPYILVLARGGGKSTTVELAVASLAARLRRKYALYVCGTQDQADDHVGNVSALLEVPEYERLYPESARPRKLKYGVARRWRRDRLSTASGFTLDAIGLDTAIRGVKIDDARPDLIVLDDIDSEMDSPAAVQKKILGLTRKILPAGSSDVIVIGIQNVVHSDGIFARLVDNKPDRADFLNDRILVGPIPAVRNLAVEWRGDRYVIVGGQPTWQGQNLEICQAQIRLWGYTAFIHEAQHETDDGDGGMFSHLIWQYCDWQDLPPLVRTVVWVDPAVTATDDSDACGIQADALGTDGKIYRLWSYEERATPEDVMQRAIAKAVELGADGVGVETDQGGDTWRSSYLRAWDAYCQANNLDSRTAKPPTFRSAKAGAGHGSKVHRAAQMLSDYERGTIVHVTGTHRSIERALRRFPKVKPFDLTDASYWSWADLRERLIPPKAAPTGPTGKSKWRRF